MNSRRSLAHIVINFADIFAAEDDGGSNGGGGTNPPADPPGGDNGGDNDGHEPPADKTFTQAELDALIDKRIARERSKFESDLKTMKDRADMDEVARLKAEINDRDQKLAERDQAAVRDRIETRAERLAGVAGVNPKRVDRFLKLLDLTDVDSLTADGKPDDKAITALIEAELAATPEFKAAADSKPDLSGEHTGGGPNKRWTREEIAKLTPDEFDKHEAEITAQMRAGSIK